MAIQPTEDGVDLLPATIELAGTEAQLLSRPGPRVRAAHRAGRGRRRPTTSVLLDCSPSLGVLTLNALTAADEVLIPLQCEMLSHRGVGQLLDTIADVQRILNPRPARCSACCPTMFDGRTNHARAVLADVSGRYGLHRARAADPASRCASPRRRPPAGRCWRRRAGPAAPRPTASSPRGCSDVSATERRLRPAARAPAESPAAPAAPGAPVDPQGRRALYSVADQPPAPGAVTIECSSCEAHQRR